MGVGPREHPPEWGVSRLFARRRERPSAGGLAAPLSRTRSRLRGGGVQQKTLLSLLLWLAMNRIE